MLATGQPQSRDLLAEVDSAAGPFQVTTGGYRFDDEVFSPASSVPLLGQHTRELLHELGYDKQHVQALVDENVVGVPGS
ncbi:MAG: hypothetical protein VYE73_14885 [Acidobacteriota bacterium]|nr:hypothetical protein [Acidobacteriota bacterium]